MPLPVFSKLEVCNQILSGLHEGPLSSISEISGTSSKAQQLRTNYDAVALFCLGRSSWRFATIKAALNKNSAAPRNRWAASWRKPVDMVKLLTTWPPSNYELQDRDILSNETTALEIDYIRWVDEAYWPGWFMRLVVAEGVIRMCKGITGDEPDATMLKEREAAEADAFFQDAQQQPNQQ